MSQPHGQTGRWGFYLQQSLIFDKFALEIIKYGNIKKSKALLYFIIFLCFTAVYGAIIALINKALRANGVDKSYTMPLLIASTIYVYWKARQWFCRKLDLIALNKD